MTHVIYKHCSTFQKKHVAHYSDGLDVFKIRIFIF